VIKNNGRRCYMRRVAWIVACFFIFSIVVPNFLLILGCPDAMAGWFYKKSDLQPAGKQVEDEAEKKGEERARGYKDGKGGKPRDDGYGYMTDQEREAYRRGYRRGAR
jgi:hypothetical protein